MAHVEEKRCPACRCSNLMHYQILDLCVGCTACARVCPVNCISGKVKEKHEIDQSLCIKCGACYNACNFRAITRA